MTEQQNIRRDAINDASYRQEKTLNNSRPAGASDLVAGHEAKGQLHARDASAVLGRGEASCSRSPRTSANDDEVKVEIIVVFRLVRSCRALGSRARRR